MGQTSFGVVYRGLDTIKGDKVAVKGMGIREYLVIDMSLITELIQVGLLDTFGDYS